MGQSLLLASLFVWLGTTSLLYQLSTKGDPMLLPWAALGGIAAGMLGTARALPDANLRADGWIVFRMLTTFVGSAAWLFILHDLYQHSDVEPSWMSFFLAVLVYTIARDVLQTFATGGIAKFEERQREARRSVQRAKVLALAAERSKQPHPQAQVFHLPAASPASQPAPSPSPQLQGR
ncbi:hypothetical protein [Fimbriimonas ginsengisoli]|uniref:Uncharacterized protein n=1 Tax=Fimbriimonas ginsengisoli Gsoil 348 TaxID=661478 RepID=A0A068NUP7_FIMGI|nr:hypothetical protein [Fimbriimonas ginsengisoli]AIE87047.1 hypothetical protein OP10G_3679 [Fimbriimonas ginsengisoli Gsoil 348]